MKPKQMTCFRLRAVTVELLKTMAEDADITQTRWIEDEIERIATTRLGPERVQAIRQAQQASKE